MSSTDRGVERGRHGPVVGYVLKVFPRMSETFVINEIRALERLGTDVRIYSLHRNPLPVSHAILDALNSLVLHVEDRAVDVSDEDVRLARKRVARHWGLSSEEISSVLPRKYVRLAVALQRLSEKEGVGHLHAHFASRAGHVAMIAGELTGVPYSMTAHAKDIWHEEVDHSLLRRKIRQSEFTVTVTDYNLAYLEGLCSEGALGPGHEDSGDGASGRSARLQRLYNGVDVPVLSALPRRIPESPVILGVGRLVEKKGFLHLVEAARILRDRGHRFHVALVGDGDLRKDLERRVQEAGLVGVVRFTGSLPTEEVVRIISGSTVMALPCVVGSDGNVDALPTVLLESLAIGTPVISTGLSGIPEIITHGVNGLLVEPGDSLQLANAIESILTDPERAAGFSEAGKARASRDFDLCTNVGRLKMQFGRPAVR